MIHPTSQVHPSVHVPESSVIWAFCNILSGVTIGENVSVGAFTEICDYCIIGDGTRISKGVFLPRRSKIGRQVFIGPHATFTDDKYPDVTKALYKPHPPFISDMASIGAAAIILPGLVIGQGARIGAGAVVTRDVPPWSTWIGVPARPLTKEAAAHQSGAEENDE